MTNQQLTTEERLEVLSSEFKTLYELHVKISAAFTQYKTSYEETRKRELGLQNYVGQQQTQIGQLEDEVHELKNQLELVTEEKNYYMVSYLNLVNKPDSEAELTFKPVTVEDKLKAYSLPEEVKHIINLDV